MSTTDGPESPLRPSTGTLSPNPNQTNPPQNLTFAALTTIYDLPNSPKPDIITYSKGVQTSDDWFENKRTYQDQPVDDLEDPQASPRTRKRLSRRERDRDEELRQNIRKEIEAELDALRISEQAAKPDGKENFPARPLTNDELNAVTASDDFLDFIDRSSKVIERALDEEYDVLADYALRGMDGLDDDEDDEGGLPRSKKARRIRQIYQFQDDRWTKGRMISDLDYSQKVP